ncbi:MAG TPA: ZIP family metal transporter [Candidatus Binatia bacterium]|jgi:zinc and cadmium transporter|nr:ZIP family metal transporter [Candidatus Binatia bacterium]
MTDPIVNAVLATVAVSLISLVGIALRLRPGEVHLGWLAFAAGTLLGTAVLDLLPEAIAHGGSAPGVLAIVTAVVLALGIAEHLVHGHAAGRSAWVVLVGDAIHNFLDGMAIAAGFLGSPGLGIATTLAIMAHEVPHELAEYGLLLHTGMSRRRAVLLNLASGSLAVVGALVGTRLGAPDPLATSVLLSITAGVFLYVGATRLLPRMQAARGMTAWAPFAGGALLPVLLGILIPH